MKILIVEDSIFVQNVIKRVISDKFPESEIITACDGEKGYALFLESKPDIITTDLLMPNLTGQEMLKKIREIDKKIPIIVISADVQKATKDEVEDQKITAFINKPLTNERAEQLTSLIKEACYVIK